MSNTQPNQCTACFFTTSNGPVGLARIASWVFQLVAAGIMLQTLFFKFTAAPEAVAIFTKLGVEPWGRIGTGVFELIAGILLLWPRFSIFGAALGIGLMVGAIGSHLTVLGIVVENDGGTLFAMAWIVLISCIAVLVLRHGQIRQLLHRPKD